MEIWTTGDCTGVKMGSFYGSAPTFTNRDYETLGDVAGGSKQTFSGLDCDVVSGDYIGGYWQEDFLEWDIEGFAGAYAKGGDQFGQGEQTYSEMAGDTGSLYATGESGVPPIDETYFDGFDIDDPLLKEVRKIAVDGFDIDDPLLMEVRKIIADGYALTDTLIAAKVLSRILTDGIAIADTLVKRVERVITDGVQVADSLVKGVGKVISDGIAFTDSLVKQVGKVITDGIAFTDIARRFVDRVLTDGIAFTDCLTRWRWLTAIRNLTRRRCVQDAVREQDSIDDGNI